MALLQFKGKQFVQNHHLTVKFHELVPKKDKSLAKKAGLNDNLIIHGDNLKALKVLLPTYGEKVKCVYIDPPYNTGNEKWKHNDGDFEKAVFGFKQILTAGNLDGNLIL